MSDGSTSHRTDHPRLGAGRGLIVTIDVEDHTPPTSAPRLDDAIVPVLDLLHERRARATFFVVGELIESRRDLLQQLMANGHELGLHGFTHRYLRDLGPKGLAEELRTWGRLLSPPSRPSACRLPSPLLLAHPRHTVGPPTSLSKQVSSTRLAFSQHQTRSPAFPAHPDDHFAGRVDSSNSQYRSSVEVDSPFLPSVARICG